MMGKANDIRSRQEELLERLRVYKESKKLAAQNNVKIEQASKKTPSKGATRTKMCTARNVSGKILANKQVKPPQHTNPGKHSNVIKVPVVTQKQNAKTQVVKPGETMRFSLSKAHVANKVTKENVTPNRKRRRSFTLEAHEVSPYLKRPVITDSSSTIAACQSKRLRFSLESTKTSEHRRRSLRISGVYLDSAEPTLQKPAVEDRKVTDGENEGTEADNTASSTTHPQATTAALPQGVATEAQTEAAHLKTTTVHSKTTTLHSKTTTVHSKTTTVHSKTTAKPAKAKVIHPKTTATDPKAKTAHPKEPTAHSKAVAASDKYLPYLNPKLSKRERLELWKKAKEQQRVQAQKRKPEKEKIAVSTTSKDMPASQSTSTITQPSHTQQVQKPSDVSKKSAVQHPLSLSGCDAPKNLLLASNLERRKSYASQVRSQFAQKTKSFDRKCSKHITRAGQPTVQQTDDKRDNNPLKRRLSYAMSLRERVENKSSSAQKASKRRITVSGLSVMNARVPQNHIPESHNKAIVSDTEPSTAQMDVQYSSINQNLTSAVAPEKVDIDDGPQAVASSGNMSVTETQKSCRKSLSVRFATDCSPVLKQPVARKKGETPVQGIKMDITPAATPSRLSPIKKEPSLREKLDTWLQSHGKTPSRFTHLLMFGKNLSIKSPNPQVKGGLDVAELLKQQEQIAFEEKQMNISRSLEDDKLAQKLDAILSECIVLLDSDCPTDTVQEWLRQVCDNLDGVQQVAKYWVCLAKIAQKTKGTNAAVSIFEESVKYNVQPPEELADALKEFVGGMNTAVEDDSSLAEYLPQTPRSEVRDVQQDNVFVSSAVKYLYTRTPFKKFRINCRRSYSTPRAVITPVRRSTRRTICNLPSMLKDHDLIIESLNQLSVDDKKQALFMPNSAIANTLCC